MNHDWTIDIHAHKPQILFKSRIFFLKEYFNICMFLDETEYYIFSYYAKAVRIDGASKVVSFRFSVLKTLY
jgi:hypothetical protein